MTNVDVQEKKRILMLSHVGFLGGAERSLLELATAMESLGDYGPMIAAPPEGGLASRTVSNSLAFIPLEFPVLRRGVGIFRIFLALLALRRTGQEIFRLVKRERVLCLHANGLKSMIPILLCPLRARKAPIVWHVRDYPRHPLLIRYAARVADVIVVPSKFIEDALCKMLSPQHPKICVVPNGVSKPETSDTTGPGIRAEVAAKDGDMIVTMLAQLVPWKRHDLFLKAAALLLKKDQTIRFLLVGGTWWEQDEAFEAALHQRVDELGLTEHVNLLGHRDDAAQILSDSDVLVLPSEQEPFGRVIIEAWYAGVPAIASDSGGPAELIEHEKTGILFKTGDAGDLALKIQRLLEDGKLRHDLSAAAREAADAYSPERCAIAVTDLYRDLLQCE